MQATFPRQEAGMEKGFSTQLIFSICKKVLNDLLNDGFYDTIIFVFLNETGKDGSRE